MEKKKVQFRPEVMSDKVLAINRVARKIKGGDKIGFTSLVAVGNKNGSVGLGYGKAPDLRSAIDKAQKSAKQSRFEVPLKDTTIPRRIRIKFSAARVLLMPAPRGAGLIAGGVVRDILELAGVRDVSAKILGTSNPVTNAKATIKALKTLAAEEARGK
ncbi:MAG: 30S ribosomal protein S5 [bacterium]|nr:30S ribosomal protein S5 [bacterium]